jgi:hypothetical protein
MFTIEVPDAIVGASLKLAQAGGFGKRGNFDGDERKRFVGFVGENYFRRWLGMDLLVNTGEPDNGIDVTTFKIPSDIKTVGRTNIVKPTDLDYSNNVLASQVPNSKTEVYIFCSLSSDYYLTCCGWLPKKDVLIRGEFCPKGTLRPRGNQEPFEFEEDNYVVNNRDITHSAESMLELFGEIYEYSKKARGQ